VVRGASLGWVVLAACSYGKTPKEPAAPPAPPSPKTRLAVLPAESDAFPKAAAALSQALASAHVAHVDATQVEKVSLEVVQISIECVDPTAACYAAVGKSLRANKLLFAQLATAAKKQVKITVTLFDVDARAPAKTAEKLFKTEALASAGVAALVSEATQP